MKRNAFDAVGGHKNIAYHGLAAGEYPLHMGQMEDVFAGLVRPVGIHVNDPATGVETGEFFDIKLTFFTDRLQKRFTLPAHEDDVGVAGQKPQQSDVAGYLCLNRFGRDHCMGHLALIQSLESVLSYLLVDGINERDTDNRDNNEENSLFFI